MYAVWIIWNSTVFNYCSIWLSSLVWLPGTYSTFIIEPHCFDSTFLDKMKLVIFAPLGKSQLISNAELKTYTIDCAYGLNEAFDDYPNTDTKVLCL